MGTTNFDTVDVDTVVTGALTVNGVTLSSTMLDNVQYQTASYTEVNSMCDMSGRLYEITATPTALSSADDSEVIVLNRAAGLALTLPAATGSGVRFDIVVGATFTGACTIKVTGDDIMVGYALLGLDGGDTCSFFATAADTDTITFAADNTTGGIAGARVKLTDIAADTWAVEVISDASGSEATPFSATV
jgi:hypothetical protein